MRRSETLSNKKYYASRNSAISPPAVQEIESRKGYSKYRKFLSYLAVPVKVSYKLVSYKNVCTVLNMLTKLSNSRIDLLQCVIVPASHAFKKKVALDGSNRIL